MVFVGMILSSLVSSSVALSKVGLSPQTSVGREANRFADLQITPRHFHFISGVSIKLPATVANGEPNIQPVCKHISMTIIKKRQRPSILLSFGFVEYVSLIIVQKRVRGKQRA